MGIFNEFHKKEKPLFTGSRYGFGGGGGAAGGSGISATGGAKIETGGYVYHVYTVDTPAPESNLNVTSGSGTIELLVVGGGGGSAFDNSGGGGAGGIAHASALPISEAEYTVSVGPGGQGSNTFGYPGHPSTGNYTRGTNSTFVHPVGTITGLGGAGPANETPTYAIDVPVPSNVYPGGSGSGGKYSYPGKSPSVIAAVPAAQPSQPTFGGLVTHYGNPGGGTGANDDFTGGGGGGAGGPGQPARPGTNAGGPGQPFTGFPAPVLAPAIPAPERPNWTPAVGPTGLFGGGGGGSSEGPQPDGAGGPGGGGTGSDDNPFSGGVYGTGGGGGSTGGSGTNGGAGIVILRYLA